MNYNVIPTPLFKKQAKRLSKKFASLKEELLSLTRTLTETPHQGTSLGYNTF